MHIPVLKTELIHSLNILPEGTYVDCTGGGGGHAQAVLDKLTSGRLIILDRDPEAFDRLNGLFGSDPRVTIVQENFRYLQETLDKLGIIAVDGLYADFGVSSFQLTEAERGFSFRKDGELDMRMDTTDSESAKDVVNKYSQELLEEIIYRYGEERFFKRIAGAIVQRRGIKPFISTLDLAAVVKSAVPAKFQKPGLHPATQTFQAIRIHVNQELVAVEALLRQIEQLVKPDGRVAFISFHSLEDRLVKNYLQRYASPCECPPEFPVCNCGKVATFKVLTRKPVSPSAQELKDNPLSRSAKLRAAVRI
ncbi:MAG: 16S rRNA (cytosine(1402)-N(4))-methyltransferase RsmH [Deferribacteraceae bacterium]|jgi:16S rRNA (cytosine1402-N4)-methyltransferase|nr:16S rRNA (cytosine(1402)-N(4))-methyltransferase RsmH [Deferribacteraceae bacterium]